MRITRKEFEEMLEDPALDLNPVARGILHAYAMHMNYKDKPVAAYKKKEQAATFAGCSPDTASKYIDALEEDGFLIDSGEVKTTKNYKSMPLYYLGRGTPRNPSIKRPKGRNDKNLKKSNSDGVGIDKPEGFGTDNSDGVGIDNSDRKGEQLRQERGATPTRSGRTTNKNNQVNNPSNNPSAADAAGSPLEEPDGSLYDEGYDDSLKTSRHGASLNTSTEETETPVTPTTEGTATPNGSGLLSWGELAEAEGFGPRYRDYLSFGLDEYTSFYRAKDYHERKIR